MPRIAPAFKGPATVIGIGGGIALVGAVPVAITLAMGIKNSATIIGVGFIGFGSLLLLPGICWCLAVQRRSLSRKWRNRKSKASADEEEHLDKDKQSKSKKSQPISYGGTEPCLEHEEREEHDDEMA